MEHIDRYISLLTDFGFKRIFGTTMNKDLLIDFLNSLFDGEHVITDVQYLNGEQLGDTHTNRRAVFDVYCLTENGEPIIVEMQNVFQEFFKDRSVFYITFPIRDQAPKGTAWDYNLKHVYIVSLLNFDMREPSFNPELDTHTVKLIVEETKQVFYPKLDMKFVELAKFKKTEDQLVTMYDKWKFVLRHLSTLSKRPQALQEKIFEKLFEEAEIAKFCPDDFMAYEDSKKAFRDLQNSYETAVKDGFNKGLAEGRAEGHAESLAEGHAEGREEGREEGRNERSIEIARKMLAKGRPIEEIMECTDLTSEEINRIN